MNRINQEKRDSLCRRHLDTRINKRNIFTNRGTNYSLIRANMDGFQTNNNEEVLLFSHRIKTRHIYYTGPRSHFAYCNSAKLQSIDPILDHHFKTAALKRTFHARLAYQPRIQPFRALPPVNQPAREERPQLHRYRFPDDPYHTDSESDDYPMLSDEDESDPSDIEEGNDARTRNYFEIPNQPQPQPPRLEHHPPIENMTEEELVAEEARRAQVAVDRAMRVLDHARGELNDATNNVREVYNDAVDLMTDEIEQYFATLYRNEHMDDGHIQEWLRDELPIERVISEEMYFSADVSQASLDAIFYARERARFVNQVVVHREDRVAQTVLRRDRVANERRQAYVDQRRERQQQQEEAAAAAADANAGQDNAVVRRRRRRRAVVGTIGGVYIPARRSRRLMHLGVEVQANDRDIRGHSVPARFNLRR
jgi:hypothetical protein